MAPIDFYYMSPSAPCRAVMLTASALDLKLNKKVINLREKEQMKPEFLAINPQHCVPTLVDGDLKLWESRAISCYLANQYDQSGSLYPKDPKARARVDRALYFDMGTLYQRFGEYVYPVILHNGKPDSSKLERAMEAVGWLEQVLTKHPWVAGSGLTIADHAVVATIATIHATGLDLSKFPNVLAWLEKCKKNMPGYEENEQGAKLFGGYAKKMLAEAK